ncbi:MAG: hypothetical protein WCG27_12270, partial [Pseudomonadota bacterium]
MAKESLPFVDLDFYPPLSEESSSFIAGVDEVGRGPLAGPVVAAVALMHLKAPHLQNEIHQWLEIWRANGVQDSKKLTPQRRQKILLKLNLRPQELRPGIKYLLTESKNFSVYALLQEISPALIDEINILQASLRAMKESLELALHHLADKINPRQGVLLVDGNKTPPGLSCPAHTLVKGDSRSVLI